MSALRITKIWILHLLCFEDELLNGIGLKLGYTRWGRNEVFLEMVRIGTDDQVHSWFGGVELQGFYKLVRAYQYLHSLCLKCTSEIPDSSLSA